MYRRRMSDPNAPTTNGSLHSELLAFIKKVYGANAVGIGILICFVVSVTLYARSAVAQTSRDAGVDAAQAAVKPLALEVEALKEKVTSHQIDAEAKMRDTARDMAEVKHRVENVERVTMETNANLKLLVESRGLKPISIDGGGEKPK